MLVVWPWAQSPFAGPKWLVTGLAAAASGVLLAGPMRPPGAIAVAALANLGSCLLSLVLAGGAAPWWTLAGPVLVASLALAEAPLPWGAVAGSAGLAAGVVLLQAVGLDPLGRFTPVA